MGSSLRRRPGQGRRCLKPLAAHDDTIHDGDRGLLVRSRWLIVLPVVTVMLVLDQWSKWLARDRLSELGKPHEIAPFLQLELVHNTGVAVSYTHLTLPTNR